VQEATPVPAGVSVFQQELEQDQEWKTLFGTGPGVGVIFKQSGFKILMVIYTVRKL